MKSFKLSKFFKITILITIISLTLLSSSVFAASSINVTINGTSVPFATTKPFVDENGRTQVPFKIVLESFGAEVRWDNTVREAIAIKEDIIVRVPIGQKYIYRNNVKITTDTSARIVSGSTYLPIKAVIEALGGQVTWNSTSRTVVLTGNISSFSDKPVSEQIKAKLQFVNDETLFTVYAFMNATGYDVENHTAFHPIREQLRKELDSMNLQLTDNNYFKTKGIPATEYVVASVHMGSYPYKAVGYGAKEELLDLNTALNEFYQKAGIKNLYAKYDKLVQPLIDSELRLEGYKQIETTANAYNLDMLQIKGNIIVYSNYLESNWKGLNLSVSSQPQNFPVCTPDIFMVSGSPNKTNTFTVNHEFMHSFTVPVTRSSYDIKRLAEYLNNQTAIALGGYGNWIDNIDESFVRAMSTYTSNRSASNKMALIDQEVADGFFLTKYIYDRIPQYETKYGNNIKTFIDSVISEFATEAAKMSFEEMADKFSPANEYGWKVDDLQFTTIVPYDDAKLKKGTVVYATDRIVSSGRALQMNIDVPFSINDVYKFENNDFVFINTALHLDENYSHKWQDGKYLYELVNTDTGVSYQVFTWLANLRLDDDSYMHITIQSIDVLPRGNYVFKLITYPTPDGFLNGSYIWDVKLK